MSLIALGLLQSLRNEAALLSLDIDVHAHALRVEEVQGWLMGEGAGCVRECRGRRFSLFHDRSLTWGRVLSIFFLANP